MLTDKDILVEVKKRFGVSAIPDDILLPFIADVIGYMISAGVKEETARNLSSVGCIWQGVSDLWNYGSGSVKFSPYFIERMLQLRD